MTKRIFRSMMAVAAAVLLISLVLFTGVLYDHFETLRIDQLRSTATYVVQGVEQEGISYFDQLDNQTYRITLMLPDGSVVYDNQNDPASMENHKDREEMQEALESGSGTSIRYSNTRSKKTINYAVRMKDGAVLRISDTQTAVWILMSGLLPPIVFIVGVALIGSAILSARVSKKIVKPFNSIDLEHPAQAKAYDELAPFLQKIATQKHEIAEKMRQQQQQQLEFQMITENMSEGLFVIDRNRTILSYNHSAMQIFGIDSDVKHQNLLTVNRSIQFQKAIDEALCGRHSSETITMDDHCYQILANPVVQPTDSSTNSTQGEEDIIGVVILAMDITEREAREQYRREFSANVSHELKTPLTSISGFAEIMMNGLVRADDIPHFSKKIYQESQRLIVLIGDIIKLSQLDEQSELPEMEAVNLLELAQHATELLEESAKQHTISVSVQGDVGVIEGIRQILEEMIYNLCENAIKYNKPGGNVTVTVSDQENTVVLAVQDTGIGIPKPDQDRVFERFYRVDKSHSKEVGGTGLGLSIVKHGAMLHHASLELESEEGVGTTVRIRFPKPEAAEE